MGEREWQADITIDRKIAKVCIEQQFPALAPINIQYINAGWDNKLFLVNDQIIFRFPRRSFAAELIERENLLLNHLQTRISLSIPNPIYLGKPCKHYPFHFHGYHIIPGRSGAHAKLNQQERKKSIIPLANFLKELHSIKKEEAIQLDAKPQKSNRSDIDSMLQRLNNRIKLIIENNIVEINQNIFNREIEIAKDIKLPENTVGLIHGDLYANHILFNNGELTGIIDWGDSGINHQSIDFGIIHCFYPERCHDIFLKHYESSIDSVSWKFARFVGLFIALSLIPYTHETGDAELKQESLDSIKRISPTLIS